MGKGEGWGEGSGDGEEWQYGLCSCLRGNCGDCCCGWFCLCCHTYTNAEKMGKSGCLYCVLGCILPCIPQLLMRGDLRDQHGIEGSTFGDCCASLFCTNCVSCQIANELEARRTAPQHA